MEKYIITFEDGNHFVSERISDTDLVHLEDGIITIIRCSDCKRLDVNLKWYDLEKWVND